VDNLQLAVDRTLAQDEEPLNAWLALGYAYVALDDCEGAAEAFGAVLDSRTADERLRGASELEIDRCGADAPAVTRESPAPPTLLPQPTLLVNPRDPEMLCLIQAANVRGGPGDQHDLIAMLEPGAAVRRGGAVVGVWLPSLLTAGGAGWVAAAGVAVCEAAAGSPAATPGGLPSPIATLFATPTATLLLTPAVPPPTLLPTPPSSPAPTATIPSSTEQSLDTESPTPTPTDTPTPTLLPAPTATATPTLLPEPTLPLPTATPTATLLPEPSVTAGALLIGTPAAAERGPGD
jgi:hypothetical protein